LTCVGAGNDSSGLVRAENQVQTRASKILATAKDTPLD
jgi:hypothetical protein